MVICAAGLSAQMPEDTIHLIQPELLNEDSDGVDEEGFVVSWRDIKSVSQVTFAVNAWNPLNGQLRVDQTYGNFGSNFTLFNRQKYAEPIIRIEMVLDSGELEKEHITMIVGSFPYTEEREAVMYGNLLIWEFDWKEDIRAFRIEMPNQKEKNAQKVVLPYIIVKSGEQRRYGSSSSTGQTEKNPPVPGDPEPPKETLPVNDPVQPIDTLQKGKNPRTQPVDMLPEQTLPTSPDVTTGNPQPQDPQKGTQQEQIIETLRTKKHLLDQLTEEEVAFIEATAGSECAYACRMWSEDIPLIKQEKSEACLAELRTMPYIELMKYVHAWMESFALIVSDLGSMVGSSAETPDERIYQMLPEMWVYGDALKEYLAHPEDPHRTDKFAMAVLDKLPFVQTVDKCNLYDYIHFKPQRLN